MPLTDCNVFYGTISLQDAPLYPTKSIFDTQNIDFLSKLSSYILDSLKRDRSLEEFIYFAHWSRKRNLDRLRHKYITCSDDLRIGRGLSLHIAPANVSSVALFSMAFGILAGNPTIVRISDRSVHRLIPIFHMISSIISTYESSQISHMISPVWFVNYDHSSTSSYYLNTSCKSRLVWGGDKTILAHQQISTQPDVVSLFFPDKISIAVVDLHNLPTTQPLMDKYVRSVACDLYIYGQTACSSPRVFIFLSSSNEIEDPNLYMFLDSLDKGFSSLPLNHRYSQKERIDAVALKLARSQHKQIMFNGQNLLVSSVSNITSLSKERLQDNTHGILDAIIVTNLDDLKELQITNLQTVLNIGLNNSQVKLLYQNLYLKGLTRVVKPGTTANMDLQWDGHDIIGALSKYVSISCQ